MSETGLKVAGSRTPTRRQPSPASPRRPVKLYPRPGCPKRNSPGDGQDTVDKLRRYTGSSLGKAWFEPGSSLGPAAEQEITIAKTSSALAVDRIAMVGLVSGLMQRAPACREPAECNWLVRRVVEPCLSTVKDAWLSSVC